MLLEPFKTFIPEEVKFTPRPQKFELLNAALEFEQAELGDSRKAKLNDVINRVGMPAQTLYAWTGGQNRPSWSYYLKFAKVYGWSKARAFELAEKDGLITDV